MAILTAYFSRMAEEIQWQDHGDTGNAKCAFAVRKVHQEQQTSPDTRRPSEGQGHVRLGGRYIPQKAVSQGHCSKSRTL